MELEKIYDSLNGLSLVSMETWAYLQSLFEPLALKRNEYFVREREKVNSCFLLLNGVVRVFFNKEGNEYNKTLFHPRHVPEAAYCFVIRCSFRVVFPGTNSKFTCPVLLFGFQTAFQ